MAGAEESSDGSGDASGLEGLVLSSAEEDWNVPDVTTSPASSDRTSMWTGVTQPRDGVSISDQAAVPRRHVVESVTEKSIALSPDSSSNDDDDEGWLHVSCPRCHGELEIHEDQLGMSGTCLWCETPIEAIRSADGSVVAREREIKEESSAAEVGFVQSEAEVGFVQGEFPFSAAPVDDSVSLNPWAAGFAAWPAPAESEVLMESPEESPAVVAPLEGPVSGSVPQAAAFPVAEVPVTSGSIWGAAFAETLSVPVAELGPDGANVALENIFSAVLEDLPPMLAIEEAATETGFGGFLQLPAEPAAVRPSEPVTLPVQDRGTLDFGQVPAAMTTEQSIFGRFAETAAEPPTSAPSLPHPQSKEIAATPPGLGDAAIPDPVVNSASVAFSSGEAQLGPVVSPKPKAKSHLMRTALLVIVFGFVCGIALASFVLPTEEYVERARIFLDNFMAPQLRGPAAEGLAQGGAAPVSSNSVAPAASPAASPAPGAAAPGTEALAGPPQAAEPVPPVAAP